MGLATTVTADLRALKRLEFLLQVLDGGVGAFEILVEPIALADEPLLPLSEAMLLDLDLLGEALSQGLLLLLELLVVQLLGSRLAEFTCLHLLGAVGLVMGLFRCVDEVEHVRADKDGAQLLEVAVVLVLNLCATPRVLATLHDASVGGFHVLLRADDGKRHGGHETTGMSGGSLIVLLDRRSVDLDPLGSNYCSNLRYV